MGVVLNARHRVLGRTVAIKLPLVGQFVGADERERFLREARAAARLHHRQICPIHEVGQIEGRPYLVLHHDDELPFPQTARIIGPPGATIRQAVFGPDCRHLATANGDGTTYILRLAPPP